LKIQVNNLRRHMNLGVHNGTITKNSSFTVDGIDLVSLKLSAGSANGTADNKKVVIEVPIEINEPVIAGGLPFVISNKFKFLVTTGFSAKNSTMTALGSWKFDGPLGFDGTTLRVPTVSEKDDLLKSLGGVSLGVNGVVTALEYRIMVGFGVTAAAAGPYAKFVVSGGFTNGSDIGMVKCKNVTFIITASTGVGMSLSSTVKTVFQKLFGKEIGNQEDFKAGEKELMNYSKSDPPTRGCKL